ncbi:uncharacterized protein EV154DRAFT_559190 [Mucor mucedo]|uniref:uncharacterized protein n=1 Tax=Mucor mucedo TaxID=29922 RepID=UPI0022207318|nr:uncharacterized protein EV154DRAFT_559190 [Mucor mucedo]KAI7895786.1 hypothetical protein EV154DRAFT_559190 [Mucor mucedo]
MHFCGTSICLVAIVLMVTSVTASISRDGDNGGIRAGVTLEKKSAEAEIPEVMFGPVKRKFLGDKSDGDEEEWDEQ